MTTFASRSTAHTPPVPAERSTLAIEWPLAHNGPATLTIVIERGSATATFTPHGAQPASLAAARPAHTENVGGLEHTDAPGVVSLTLKHAADGSRELLYARTPLLDSLGVRGGCVERPRLISG